MLGVTQTLESEMAELSHSGTHAAGNHHLSIEYCASKPSNSDRRHRITSPQKHVAQSNFSFVKKIFHIRWQLSHNYILYETQCKTTG